MKLRWSPQLGLLAPNFHLEIHMGRKVALQNKLSPGQPSEGQEQPHTQSYLEVQVVPQINADIRLWPSCHLGRINFPKIMGRSQWWTREKSGYRSFPFNSSWRNGSIDRISYFMSGYNVGGERLESLIQDGTETDTHKDELEFKKKILCSTYSDY